MTSKKRGSGTSEGWTTYSLQGRRLSKKVGTGKRPGAGAAAKGVKTGQAAKKPSDLWRRPMDLTPELAARLLHGLAENHRDRLEVLARRGGRATVAELLAVTGDSDLRVLSYFQGALSRKIRRLAGDREKRLHLIGWDYDATEWNAAHTAIVNGVCYVSDATLVSLQQALGLR